MSRAYASALDLSSKVPRRPAACARPTTGRRSCSSSRSSLHLLRVVLHRARSAGRASSTGSSASRCSALALLEGFAGYSLLDDLLSGMGLAIAYGVALSIPLLGGALGTLIWDGQFPGRRRVRAAALHRPRLPPARRCIGRADRRAPGADRAPAPHAVPRAPAARAQRRRLADVARATRCARSGCSRPSRPCSCSLGGLVQINPIWQWGPYEPWLGDERRAARLVPRLADRRAAADAAARDPRLRPHARAQPVLRRRALSRGRLRPALRVAVARARASRATAAHTTCSTARATTRGAPRSARRSSRWVALIFVAGAADRLFYRSASPTRARSTSSAR